MPKLDLEIRAQWKELVLQQKSSGLSIKKFCLQKNLKIHKFYYFKRIHFPKKIKKSSFIEILPAATAIAKLPPPSLTLQLNNLNLIFEGDYDNKKIIDLVILLKNRI